MDSDLECWPDSEDNPKDDRMAALICLQKSGGAFEIPSDKWTNSVFEVYLGKYEDCNASCPAGLKINLWVTALAIKVLELKMIEKRDIWELAAKKSKKYLLNELKDDGEQCQILLSKAEEYINNI